MYIQYGCNQSIFTCLSKKRTFSREQHEAALQLLTKMALPGKEMRFGLMGSGFEIVEGEELGYKSNGLFIADKVIYSYVNSHL